MDHPAVIFRFVTVWKRRQGMAFREVQVTEVKEVLRAWLAGQGKRPAAQRAGVNVKTAQRYIAAAQQAGLVRGGGESQLTDELIGAVVAAVRPARPAGHGVSWEALVPVQDEITAWVKQDLTLVKIGELLARRGIEVPYRTLARFAAAECGYSSARSRVTVPVTDGEPGREVQVDFGYLGMIRDGDKRRKLHALVFTAVVSRYCFVYLTFSQTTEAVIAGCEEAWAFFGGMFAVLIPDNLSPVVSKADRIDPQWNREWLEYMQARGLACDPARVRSPQDKGRVESGVKFVQRSFFAGEDFNGIGQAQPKAVTWCRDRAGMRVHGTTRQRPAEVFAGAEAGRLLPVPDEPYRMPVWSEATVQRDFHVRAQNAFYSVPHGLIGQRVSVRADGTLVKIYHRGQVVRTHPQQPAGGRASDPADFPPGTDVYARRDVDKLARMAAGPRRGGRDLRRPGPGHRSAVDEDARRLRPDRAVPHLRQRRGGAGVRGGAGAGRDQRRQDPQHRGEGHRRPGSPGRGPRAAGRRGGPEGHRRPGSPATPASSPPPPASGCRSCPAGTAPPRPPATPDPARAALISSHRISLHCIASRFVSSRFACACASTRGGGQQQ